MAGEGAFVNGVYYDWASMEIKLGGTTVVAIKSVDYDDELEREPVYGAGNAPLGTGTGNYKSNFKCSVHRETYDGILAAKFGDGVYHHKPFDAAVSYAKEGGKTVTDSAKGLRLLKRSFKGQQGDKESMVELEFFAYGGLWIGGKKPIKTGKK